MANSHSATSVPVSMESDVESEEFMEANDRFSSYSATSSEIGSPRGRRQEDFGDAEGFFVAPDSPSTRSRTARVPDLGKNKLFPLPTKDECYTRGGRTVAASGPNREGLKSPSPASGRTAGDGAGIGAGQAASPTVPPLQNGPLSPSEEATKQSCALQKSPTTDSASGKQPKSGQGLPNLSSQAAWQQGTVSQSPSREREKRLESMYRAHKEPPKIGSSMTSSLLNWTLPDLIPPQLPRLAPFLDGATATWLGGNGKAKSKGKSSEAWGASRAASSSSSSAKAPIKIPPKVLAELLSPGARGEAPLEGASSAGGASSSGAGGDATWRCTKGRRPTPLDIDDALDGVEPGLTRPFQSGASLDADLALSDEEESREEPAVTSRGHGAGGAMDGLQEAGFRAEGSGHGFEGEALGGQDGGRHSVTDHAPGVERGAADSAPGASQGWGGPLPSRPGRGDAEQIEMGSLGQQGLTEEDELRSMKSPLRQRASGDWLRRPEVGDLEAGEGEALLHGEDGGLLLTDRQVERNRHTCWGLGWGVVIGLAVMFVLPYLRPSMISLHLLKLLHPGTVPDTFDRD